MADITTFESRRANILYQDEIFNTPKKTLLYLIDAVKKYENNPNYEGPRFDKGYLPEVQYTSPDSTSDVFLNTTAKTFEIDGAQSIRYILLDKHGKIYEDLESQWNQVLPNSYLARISCSYRNFDPTSLMLDYFIDLNDITIVNESEFGISRLTLQNKSITGDYITNKDGKQIKIHEFISDFNNHKKDIFVWYFKYDFGSAINSIRKDNY